MTPDNSKTIYKVIKREGQQMMSAVTPFPYAVHYPYYQWYHGFLPLFVFLDREDAVEWLVRVRWANNEKFELWRGMAKETFQVYDIMNSPENLDSIQWFWKNIDIICYALNRPYAHTRIKIPYVTDSGKVLMDDDWLEMKNLVSQSWFICPAPEGTYATRDLILTEMEDV